MPKMNDIPACPAIPNPSSASTLRDFQIELITPLFGGGVETRVNDDSFPIRPTAIRGHLQLWWRATIGAQFATRKDLREAQSEIWGSTKRPSQVQVVVEYPEKDIAKPIPCARYEYKPPGRLKRARHDLVWHEPFAVPQQRHWGVEYVPRDLTYALFPFQGEKAKRTEPGCTPEVEPATAIHSARFRLIVKCPDHVDFQKDVEPALWAWTNFGGLGSRTRRGCGAIFCKELAPKNTVDMGVLWKRYIPDSSPLREWPTLANAVLAGTSYANSIDAWDDAIGAMRYFRQGSDFARAPGSPPSRSWFPEPDTIRRITNSWKPGHEPRDEIPDGFPRAEFGLPIVFHFKDGKRDATSTGPFEPYDTVLQVFFPELSTGGPKLDAVGMPSGITKERMASPLILKPTRLIDGTSIPLILWLNTELPTHVELQDNKTHDCLTPRRAVPVRDPGFASGQSPINGRSTVGSALEAFIAFARSRGFMEVTR